MTALPDSPPGTTYGDGDAGRTPAGFARPRLALGLLAAVFAIHFLDRQLFAILIPPIKAELGLSDTALGFLAGFAFTLLYSFAGLLIARIADRTDRVRVIAWSLAFFSAMTALCGFATGFWQLLAARLGVGAGEGGTNPASHALIADAFAPGERSTAMAIYSVGPNLGIVLAFGLGGWAAQSHGWRAAFFAAGGLGLALAIVVRLLMRDPRAAERVMHRREPPAATEVMRAIFRSEALRNLFLAATLATAAALAVVTWLPAVLTRSHGLTLAQAGVYLAAVIGIAGAAGTYACGRYADRASRGNLAPALRFLTRLHLLLALLLTVALAFDDRAGFLVALAPPLVLVGGYIGPSLALAQGLFDPRARALSAAIYLLVVNLIGAGVGPLVVGALSDLLTQRFGAHALRYAIVAAPVFWLAAAWYYGRASRALSRVGSRVGSET